MRIRSGLREKIVLVAALCLLFVPFPAESLWWREFFNSGHTVLFAILSIVIYRQIKANIHFSNVLVVYVLVLFVGMSFGVIAELLQGLMQRDPSLNDLYGDFFGLMAGLFLIAAYNLKDIQHKKLVAAPLIMASAGFILIGLSALIRLSWYYVERHDAFPVIIDFDASWSSRFLRFDNVEKLMHTNTTQRRGLFPFCFNRGEYPAISVVEPESDWTGYHSLRVDVFSENEKNVVLTLRIHDDKHNQDFSDRFNMKLPIRPGLNEIEVPLDRVERGPSSRKLDLANVAGIELFVSRLDEHIRLEVSNIFLE